MCLQSKIIYNPFCESIKLPTYHFVVDGKDYYLPNLGALNWITKAKSITGWTTDQKLIYDLTHSCFLVLNGAKVPAYVNVKCGKCVECLHEKRSHFVSRCLLELITNPFPVFVTLTYPDNELATASYNEVSNFNKRLRANLRNYGIDLQFRSVFVDELSPSGRFHHHGILFFNRPYYDEVGKLFTIIKECWTGIPSLTPNHVIFRGEPCNLDKFGHPIYRYGLPYANNSRKTDRSRFAVCVETARNPISLTRYVSKYITKDSVTKVHTPRKIALGCGDLPYIKSLFEISDDMSIKFNVGGQVLSVSLPPEVISRIYPSLSQQYDLSQLRKSLYILSQITKVFPQCFDTHSHVCHYFRPKRTSENLSCNMASIIAISLLYKQLNDLPTSEKINLLYDISDSIINNFEASVDYTPTKFYILTTIKSLPTLSYDDYHEQHASILYCENVKNAKKVCESDLFL